eukprot:jgi/Tetstr1/455585/TSEL_042397.t1
MCASYQNIKAKRVSLNLKLGEASNRCSQSAFGRPSLRYTPLNRMNRSGVVIALVLAGLSAAYGLSEEQLQQLGLGTGPPEVQDHCADSSNYCREWALRGECDRNPRYMLQGCRKSCKRCIPKHEDLFLQDSRQIRLHTSYGTIAINIYRTAAPKTTYKLLHIAQRGARGCTRCKIYRAEGNEVTYASGHHGQGLLQGTFASLNDAPSLEGNLAVRRGHVALLPNTREFIIALRDHPEFGLAHTVFGEIDAQSQAVVDAIAGQPGKEFSHPVYGNPMRILQDDVPFTVDAFKPGAPSAADIRKAENLARHRATHLNMTLPEMSAKGMLDDLVETGLNITRLLESEQAASSPAPPAADRMEQVTRPAAWALALFTVMLPSAAMPDTIGGDFVGLYIFVAMLLFLIAPPILPGSEFTKGGNKLF